MKPGNGIDPLMLVALRTSSVKYLEPFATVAASFMPPTGAFSIEMIPSLMLVIRRRVAAQFQRGFLDRCGALLHQQFADLGRAGEGQFAHGWVTGQLAADFVRRPGDTGKHTLWQPGALGEFAQG